MKRSLRPSIRLERKMPPVEKIAKLQQCALQWPGKRVFSRFFFQLCQTSYLLLHSWCCVHLVYHLVFIDGYKNSSEAATGSDEWIFLTCQVRLLTMKRGPLHFTAWGLQLRILLLWRIELWRSCTWWMSKIQGTWKNGRYDIMNDAGSY